VLHPEQSGPKHPAQLLGPPTLLFRGWWSSLLEVKQLGCDVEHLFPSSTDLKYEWSYVSAPSVNLHGMYR